MDGVTVHGVEEYPADRYVVAVLIAQRYPPAHDRAIKHFLSQRAFAFNMCDNVYHLGSSTVLHRSIPLDSANEGLLNIALNIVAKSRSEVEQSIAKIVDVFPEFKEYPPDPDPLPMLDRNS